jgi:hypothetical protein
VTVRSQIGLPIFDLTGTPFSAPGSWLSVSPVVGQHVTAEHLHIASHRTGMHPVFQLRPVADGVPIAATVAATPAELTWSNSYGVIRLTFAGPERIRISGTGLGFEIRAADPVLTPFEGTYAFADPDSAFVFTSYETGFRYRVMSLAGDAALIGSQALGAADRAVVVPAGQHGWDLELHEYRAGAADDRPRPAFEELVGSNIRAFATFADLLVGDPAASTELLACYVLWSALVSPGGFVRRPVILMSKNWMDKVWAWDPCFNAIALADAHPQLAVDQFLAVFDHQDVTTGAIPDSVTHSEVLFNFVKPPVHGWAIEQIRERMQRPLIAEELSDVFEKLSRWTDFWLEHRRSPGSVLCHYEHGNDSGWDNATTFAGERLLETADLATLLIAQLRALARLADELGLPDVALLRVGQADAMCAALLERLWDGERFTARSVITGARHGSNSLLDLIPIVIADQLPNDVTNALVERIEAHLTPVGLATELLSSPLYEADGYWRGPVWAPSTVLVVDGLRRAGRGELADEVAARFRRTCQASGFAENFEALTGEGLRDRAYTWTASGYLILQPRRERGAAA